VDSFTSDEYMVGTPAAPRKGEFVWAR